MSINFNNPVDPEASSMIKELFGKPVAEDDKTFLFNQQLELHQKQMSELARKAGQPVVVELNSEGEIKTMRDGTRYQVTPKGWRKLTDPEGKSSITANPSDGTRGER